MWVHKLDQLRSENEDNMLQLNEDDCRKIKHMTGYMDLSKISSVEREVMRKDLIGMALEAELRGESLDEVIGAEKEFCDEIIRNSSRDNWLEYSIVMLKELLLKALVIIMAFGSIGHARSVSVVAVGLLSACSMVIVLMQMHLFPKYMLQKERWKEVLIFLLYAVIVVPVILLAELNQSGPQMVIWMWPAAGFVAAGWGASLLLHDRYKAVVSKKLLT